MKVKPEIVATGIVNYAEEHILPMIQDWHMWVGALALEWLRPRITNTAMSIVEDPMVKMLGLIDDEGLVNVDDLISTCKITAKKHGKLEITVATHKFALTDSDFDVIQASIEAAA